MEADDPASANERVAQPESNQSEAEEADNGNWQRLSLGISH